jgi:hypothetical protein
MFTDIASLVSQLSFVADGMRIRISLSPKICALHIEDLLTGLPELCISGDTFSKSLEGKIARLFGSEECDAVTVIVRVAVLTAMEVVIDSTLITGRVDVAEGVEMGTADMALLLIDIAGVE